MDKSVNSKQSATYEMEREKQRQISYLLNLADFIERVGPAPAAVMRGVSAVKE